MSLGFTPFSSAPLSDVSQWVRSFSFSQNQHTGLPPSSDTNSVYSYIGWQSFALPLGIDRPHKFTELPVFFNLKKNFDYSGVQGFVTPNDVYTSQESQHTVLPPYSGHRKNSNYIGFQFNLRPHDIFSWEQNQYSELPPYTKLKKNSDYSGWTFYVAPNNNFSASNTQVFDLPPFSNIKKNSYTGWQNYQTPTDVYALREAQHTTLPPYSNIKKNADYRGWQRLLIPDSIFTYADYISTSLPPTVNSKHDFGGYQSFTAPTLANFYQHQISTDLPPIGMDLSDYSVIQLGGSDDWFTWEGTQFTDLPPYTNKVSNFDYSGFQQFTRLNPFLSSQVTYTPDIGPFTNLKTGYNYSGWQFLIHQKDEYPLPMKPVVEIPHGKNRNSYNGWVNTATPGDILTWEYQLHTSLPPYTNLKSNSDYSGFSNWQPPLPPVVEGSFFYIIPPRGLAKHEYNGFQLSSILQFGPEIKATYLYVFDEQRVFEVRVKPEVNPYTADVAQRYQKYRNPKSLD